MSTIILPPAHDPQLVTSHECLPRLIRQADQKTGKPFFEFFTVTIRNEHTRRSYLHSARLFFEWCEARGLRLETVEPIHVAAYVETLTGSKTTIKQHMSALRMLFSYFVEKGVLPFNPAREVLAGSLRTFQIRS